MQIAIYVIKQKQLRGRKLFLDYRRKDSTLLSLFTFGVLTVLYLYSFQLSPGASLNWSLFPDD